MAAALTDVVICEPVRTPVGRRGGALAPLQAADLAAAAIRGLVECTGVEMSRPASSAATRPIAGASPLG